MIEGHTAYGVVAGKLELLLSYNDGRGVICDPPTGRWIRCTFAAHPRDEVIAVDGQEVVVFGRVFYRAADDQPFYVTSLYFELLTDPGMVNLHHHSVIRTDH